MKIYTHCSSIRRALLWLLFIGVTIPSIAQQDSTEAYSLDTMEIVSFQRQKQSIRRSAAAVSILKQTQLNQLSARSTPEALMHIPGVWMQKTNHGGGSPFVRGLTGNQTLLMIDGIRLNNSTYRYGPNQYLNTIDPWSISRVEVLRGSGSAQYGSDALGGVIQMFTPTPSYSADGFKISSFLRGKWMSHGMEKSARIGFEASNASYAMSIGLSLKDFGDMLAGGDLGYQAPSAYTERDADVKARIKLGKRQELILAYQSVSQNNVGRYDQVAQRGYLLYEFEPQQRQLFYTRWLGETDKPLFSSFKLTLSQQINAEGRIKQKLVEDFQTLERDEVITRALNFEFNSILSSNWSAVSGVEFYRDLVYSSAYTLSLPDSVRRDQRGLYPDDAAALNASLFSLHQWDYGQWQYSAGLRYNVFRLETFDPEFGDQDVRPQALVGNAAIQYQFKPSLGFFIAFNSGFRAPNINDLSSFGSFDSGIEVPVSQLKPERSYSLELGMRYQDGPLRLALFAYRTLLTNLIARVPSTYQGADSLNGEAVFAKANVDQAFIQGLEGEIGYRFNQYWQLNAFATYTYGAKATDLSPLRRIPPFHASVQFRYIRPDGWFATLEWQAAAAQTRLSSGDIRDHRIADGGTPAWQILNLYIGYQYQFLQLTLGFQNINNQAYRMHGSGVDGYGRSLWLSTNLNF
ncbi:MAG: TonB-dependent receptor plug domain-containing protein [Bacteroidia bacterium]